MLDKSTHHSLAPAAESTTGGENMKAIFEFDAPESCVKCPISKGNPVGSGTYCAGCKQAFYESYSKQNQRAPFCPLKIVPDDTTAEPEPLTLEQLREMDGQPVWVEVLENAEANPPYWAIIDNVGYRSAGVDLISHLDKDFGAYELYGETWLAYPRKPREG